MRVIALSVPDAEISSTEKPPVRAGRAPGERCIVGRGVKRRPRGPAVWRFGLVLLAGACGIAGAAPHPEAATRLAAEPVPMSAESPSIVSGLGPMARRVGEAGRERQWATHRSSLRRVVRWAACPADAAPGTCLRSRCMGGSPARAPGCAGSGPGGLHDVRGSSRSAEAPASRPAVDPPRRIPR